MQKRILREYTENLRNFSEILLVCLPLAAILCVAASLLVLLLDPEVRYLYPYRPGINRIDPNGVRLTKSQ